MIGAGTVAPDPPLGYTPAFALAPLEAGAAVAGGHRNGSTYPKQARSTTYGPDHPDRGRGARAGR
jgi:hypothetical protein